MTSPFGSSPPIGTHLFASHIVQDSSLSVFRQFAVLNARNLLYLQSELASLEAKILQLDERANDMTKGNDTWATPRSWRAMRNAGLKAESEASEGENGEMWKVALDVRRVLKEYNEALQAQAWLHTRTQPTKRSREAILHLLNDNPSMLSKGDAEYLEKQDDLIALGPESHNEALSQFLEDHLYRHFQTEADRRRSSPDSPLDFFSESRIRSTIRILAIIVSSVLPILSIVVLYFIKSNIVRLGVIVAFNVLCSTALAVLTHATNSEIITAAATYAAVQVVFVGSINSGAS